MAKRLLLLCGLLTVSCTENHPTPQLKLLDKLILANCAMATRCDPAASGQCESTPEYEALLNEGLGITTSPQSYSTTFGSLAAIQASIDAGKIRVDQSKVEPCLEAIRSRACSEFDLSDSDAALCRSMFTGLVPPGGVCIANEACADRAECQQQGDWDSTDCMATCVVLPEDECNERVACPTGKVCSAGRCIAPQVVGGLNERCDLGNTICAQGLTCSAGCTQEGRIAWLCLEPIKSGEACTAVCNGTDYYYRSCEDGTICGGNTLNSATCRGPKPYGSPCDGWYDCESRLCDANQGTCTLRPTQGPCVQSESALECDYGFWCDTSLTTPECKPLVSAGGECPNTAACGYGATCVLGADGVRRCQFDPEFPLAVCQP